MLRLLLLPLLAAARDATTYPPLAAYGAVAPDVPVEVTSSNAGEKLMRRHPSRFVVVMQAPRVGSKMLCSMLKSYDKGVVYMRMEGADRDLQVAYPNKTVASRLNILFDESERGARRGAFRSYVLFARRGRGKARDKTRNGRGVGAAVGFKTAKTMAWDSLRRVFKPSATYDFEPAGPAWRKLGVRVLCLARLNGFAWTLSGARKSSQAHGTVKMDCGEGALMSHLNKTEEHTRQFYRECQKLGEETRALWVPYEAIKDGSPRQKASLATVLDFLKLDPSAKIGADTKHFSPGASAAYVENAAECRATMAANPYLLGMLDDPTFPYGKY